MIKVFIFQLFDIRDFFISLHTVSVSCKETDHFAKQDINYKSLIINSFARSMTEESIEAKYICVVAIES